MNEINIPLDIKSLEIIAQPIDKNGNIILDVESRNTRSTCHQCGKPATIGKKWQTLKQWVLMRLR